MFSHDPTLIFRLILLLRKERPDIVRTYNWGSIEGILAARISGIKSIIYSEHGFNLEEIVQQKRRRILIRGWLLRFCDRIIVPAKRIQKWLIDVVGVTEEKIVYIPNGCNTDRFYPGKDEKAREMLGIKNSDIVVGTVGSLNKIKGQDLLMEAFAKASNGNMRLVIVGEGPERERLAEVAAGANIGDKVIFTGRIVDPAPLYRAMDIFVLPSLSENAPNSLLEAMSTGLPVIATDVGDVSYILEEGRCGIIVKPNDVSAIAHAIDFYLRNNSDAAEKGAFSRQRALELFNVKKMISAYESLYISLMERYA
jgi:glycosyltransferase involved in cell wall biosynthesis